MGCGSSKNTGVENSIQILGKDAILDTKPDILRRDINAKYFHYSNLRDKLLPYHSDKYTILYLTSIEKQKWLSLIPKMEQLKNARQPYLDKILEKDADDLYKAFQKFGTDKSVLVFIICARTYDQIGEISKIFERKYGIPLLAKIVNELTTVLGSLLTGAGTGLSKLLTYRILPQPERDAAILYDCTSGMTLDDEGLLEVLCTRSNLELRLALEFYQKQYKRDLSEVIKNKCSYKNYRDFVLSLLSCNRDESDKPLDPIVAQQYANELYAAGAGRTLGIDPEPFLRILPYLSHQQFLSVNNCYKDRKLIADIKSKLGGDFQQAVVIRCTDKYEYLAQRLDDALKGFSTNKEAISRILGCLSRPECVNVKLSYNRLGLNKSLEETLKVVLKNQTTFYNACALLMSEDMSLTPLGSDLEIHELATKVKFEAERISANELNNNLNQSIIATKGKEIISVLNQKSENENFQLPQEYSEIDIALYIEEKKNLELNWDGKGKNMDVLTLGNFFNELVEAEANLKLYAETAEDELKALKEIYHNILQQRYETELYIREYNSHCHYLRAFCEKRMK